MSTPCPCKILPSVQLIRPYSPVRCPNTRRSAHEAPVSLFDSPRSVRPRIPASEVASGVFQMILKSKRPRKRVRHTSYQVSVDELRGAKTKCLLILNTRTSAPVPVPMSHL